MAAELRTGNEICCFIRVFEGGEYMKYVGWQARGVG